MDIISYLPASIRSYIVSFLPMKDAFRTSTLSKQWRDHVPSSLSNLKFDQLTFDSKTVTFNDFVYQTFLQHDGSDVENIYLTVRFDTASAHHLNSWISFAVRHKVKELELAMVGELETPPPQLFSCKSLTSLRLFGIASDLPTIIHLPVLKTMYLERVKFYDASHSSRLISGCPTLEDLTLVQCTWIDLESHVFIISAPILRFLKLLPSNPYPNVKISCPILHEIRYRANPPDIDPETLSSLVELDLMYFSTCLTLTKTTNEHMSKILMGLQNVVSLDLDSFCMELLTRDPDLLSHLPTSCCSLKELSLEIFLTRLQVQLVTDLLRSYPNLQTLYVNSNADDTYVLNKGGYRQLPEFHTEGTLNQLKKVHFACFSGIDCEFDLVSHLIKNANEMEQMSFTLSHELELDVPSKESVCKKLLQITRVSPKAKIKFGYPDTNAFYGDEEYIN